MPIPPTLARQLAEHIAAHRLGPDDYVFTVNGGPVNYSSFYKHVFKPATRAVGLPTLRFHDLRHTFAALKLGQGYGIHELKEWMGHATVKWVRGDEDSRPAKDDAAFLSAAPHDPGRGAPVGVAWAGSTPTALAPSGSPCRRCWRLIRTGRT